MICLGLISNHFVLLSLKDGCPLPPSSTEWRNHRSNEAATWDHEFLDQHDRFRTLMEIEDKERPFLLEDLHQSITNSTNDLGVNVADPEAWCERQFTAAGASGCQLPSVSEAAVNCRWRLLGNLLVSL
ncbi:hypothetical protein MTR_8g465250 [Medicago truncatula]|uniref:Uncharacterized protein n=1 Tax=Medicago truncatula TaxID=3880 RepID=A0A072TQX8_MEDTR|nr:hypothetical protein MTR_8g465250 [Medicago truncatula]